MTAPPIENNPFASKFTLKSSGAEFRGILSDAVHTGGDGSTGRGHADMARRRIIVIENSDIEKNMIKRGTKIIMPDGGETAVYSLRPSWTEGLEVTEIEVV